MSRSIRSLLVVGLLTATSAAWSQSFDLSADRIADILRKDHFAFEGAELQPHPGGAAKGFVLHSQPKGRPAMTVKFFGKRETPGVVTFEYGSPAALQDNAGERVLGELIRLLLPALGPGPSWRARDDAGKEIDPLHRWSVQVLAELDIGDFQWQPLRTWHAGGRGLLAFREPNRRDVAAIAFYVGPALQTAHEPAAPPRHPAVAGALADYRAGQYDRALAALRLVAAGGEAEAQAWLFDAMYLRRTDIGVTLDAERMKRDDAARERIALGLQAAAAKGEPHALYWSAIRNGGETLQNDEADFAARAARLGHSGGQFHWARHLLRGDKTLPDAAGWMEIAARQGNWLAIFAIGKMYEDGLGRAKNPARAYFWYRVFDTRLGPLAAVDREFASSFANGPARELEPAERARLDAVAARWRPALFADVVKECASFGCPKDLKP